MIEYRGFQTQTKSGLLCQQWDSQAPHAHGFEPALHLNDGLDANYCRNPDNADTIWCYTTDPSVRWEYCDPLPGNLYIYFMIREWSLFFELNQFLPSLQQCNVNFVLG